VFDEAHLFFGDHGSRLCEEIESLVATMRHEAMRVIITTQLPAAVPDGLFHLATFAVLHHLDAPEVWDKLAKHFAVPRGALEALARFSPGRGLLVASRDFETPPEIQVRRRHTADIGGTKAAA